MLSRSFYNTQPFGLLALLALGACVSDMNTIRDTSVTTVVIETDTTEVDSASEISFTEEEVQAIVDEIMNGDTTTVDAFSDEELEAFVDALQEYGIYPDLDGDDGEPPPPPSGLPACSGYWGVEHKVETVEEHGVTDGLLYAVGPNCMMWAPGDDCGTDHDDYMLSFYFGYHSQSISTLKAMLKWYSSDPLVLTLLNNLTGRLYQQTSGGGPDNYNFYACLDDFFGGYLETFELRKY